MCIHFLRVPAAVQYNKTRNQTKAKGYMMNYNTVHWHAMQSRLIQYVPTQHKYIQCDEKQSTQLTPQALTRACARSLAHSHTHTHTQFFLNTYMLHRSLQLLYWSSSAHSHGLKETADKRQITFQICHDKCPRNQFKTLSVYHLVNNAEIWSKKFNSISVGYVHIWSRFLPPFFFFFLWWSWV